MVGLPDAQNREKILKVNVPREKLSPDVDFKAIAEKTDGYSGSDLKNMCIAAAHRTIKENLEKEQSSLAENKLPSLHVRGMNIDDFQHAYEEVKPSVALVSDDMQRLQEWKQQLDRRPPN